jgi:MEMO1 family protein
VPLIQLAFPNAAILPIEVPAVGAAPLIGRKTAQTLARQKLKAVYLASSDLTHYGPSYGYAPAGVGPDAMQWTKDNDRRLLDLALARDPAAIVPEAEEHLNACGAGAIAAMLAACNELGASRASLLSHATSYETLRDVAPQPPTNAVGYASLVVG